MNPNQALWEKGDFTTIARLMRESGADLVQSLAVDGTHRVLDLGCGDGTTALPLARLGAEVLGVDLARNLVDAGRKRAAEAKLDRLTFQHGDACALTGIPAASFDLTLSVFGAMFAPKPFDVASEMVRVTKPGGRVVMGNWVPNDPTSFVSQLLRISAAFTPPPPEGFVSPMLWGVEERVRERFGHAGIAPDRISFLRDVFYFRSVEFGPEEMIVRFRRFYGPTMNAYDAAARDGRTEDLHAQLVALAHSQNRAPAGQTLIPATFMRVTVQV